MKEGKFGVKAIIFDVGGVLALGKYFAKPKRGHRQLGVHEEIARRLGITLDQWFDAIDTNYALSIEGKITKNKVISLISKNAEVSSDVLEKTVIGAYRSHFKQNKWLYRQAFFLKRRGYKIAILSDQWHISKEALMLEKYTKKFDSVVVSCDSGVRKPNPKIYRLVLKKLKLKPEEAIFIDNQKWNISPAKKMGMKTILFKDNHCLMKDPKWINLFK